MILINRRGFIRKGIQLAGIPFVYPFFRPEMTAIAAKNLKLSLNAYSFNAALRSGSLSLEQLFDYCAGEGFAAVDLTAYYIPDYPEVPADQVLFGIRKMAHHRGLHISGTGVRNDFTLTDRTLRMREIDLVKRWVVAAAKLGAPVLRVFAGPSLKDGERWEEKAELVIASCRECARYAAEHGVIVALQNHNEFVQTAEQVDYIMEGVGEEWFGLVLDIGSYSQHDPYSEISKNIQYAVNWQIKENVNHFGSQRAVDLERLMAIIRKSDYQGYLPIETLGPGDPFEKVSKFLGNVKSALRGAGLAG
ncbi:Sugar phosphate isomerase/epimerase [Cyclobacterium lianum]|uniref:Sugar phosphate isomerase/epimerase n=1 Tax=Cyclobacterium lianum TaxID=388280 RepID=A0A1M7QFG6_9BACT|nr:sugar phosphate isomerase/epimerase family protein [Cyclobacterium lianum]SHN29613.1 Sugar phosphate isomerase/epimerase [Cyclobacterium lianum]